MHDHFEASNVPPGSGGTMAPASVPLSTVITSTATGAVTDTTARTSTMGLLPCLRRGSDRWWLPRSPAVTEVLGKLLLRRGRGDSVDSFLRAQICRTIVNDPPLLIYAALGIREDRAGPEALADWLIAHAVARFSSGDAFLSTPTIDSLLTRRWNQLRDHYRTLPIETWLDDAALWLEATGPKVSAAWQSQWPRIIPPSNGIYSQTPSDSDDLLAQIARTAQHQRSLERSFDRCLHKSKLGALKQLAYGLSHEINNPLANISTRAQSLQRAEQDPARVATLQRIIDQVYRAHEMIADLMFYANPPEALPARSDLTALLPKIADSFTEEVNRQSIRLDISIPEQSLQVTADATMIGEALRALIRNSIDAIGCQGTIVVSLVQESGRTMIHVADSGPGLSELARQHAFDPYFSGREAGRGLGLGLCRAYRIAKLHHGDITLAGGPAGCVATITLNNHLPS